MSVIKISISMERALYERLQKTASSQKRRFSNLLAHIAETMLPEYEKRQSFGNVKKQR